ncbi:hypothetical protein TrST_g10452 [Triparma strigata]|uniref:Uncharacterized protein n=1 Tax=Triparma strigata TaxID=1606541 RepID=A0A9W7BA67_9STRA|nr:hypothetical protein TrST_g10452 [Triparma strigata]
MGTRTSCSRLSLRTRGGASPSTSKTIVHWSFVEKSKEYNLLLRLQVEERQDDGEIRIAVGLLALTTSMLVRERLTKA